MKKILVGPLLVLVPLVLIVIWALATYGIEGPADDDARANAIFYVLGFFYALYLAAVCVYFIIRQIARRQASEPKR